MVSALQLLLMALQPQFRSALSAGVNLGVLVVGLAAFFFARQWAASVTLAVFLPLVCVPAVFMLLARRHALKGDYAIAEDFAKWATRFHPSTHHRFLTRLYGAYSHKQAEARIRAFETLQAREQNREKTRLIDVLIAVEKKDWEAVCALLKPIQTCPKNQIAVATRALGEMGDKAGMIEAWRHSSPQFGVDDHWSACLCVLAFTGRIGLVDVVLTRKLKGLDADAKTYWRAVARVNVEDADMRADGIAMLHHLATTKPNTRTASAAAHYLDRLKSRATNDAPTPPLSTPPLSARAQADLLRLERQVRELQTNAKMRWRHWRGTILIAVVLSVMFGVELYYDATQHLSRLVAMGAMWPPALFLQNEWWRLATATLLHGSWLHILANGFVLLFLGPVVERGFGFWRTMVGYGLGCVLSSAAVYGGMMWGIISPAVLVGASGGLLALFGMEIARQVLVWRRTRALRDRKRVILLTAILMMQVFVDLSFPQISLGAHLSGAIIGFVFGLCVWPRGKNRRQSRVGASGPKPDIDTSVPP